MGDSQFLGNLFTKLHDFVLQKPVMYTPVFLPSIYIAYFHVTVGYNLRSALAGFLSCLFPHTHFLLSGNMNCSLA